MFGVNSDDLGVAIPLTTWSVAWYVDVFFEIVGLLLALLIGCGNGNTYRGAFVVRKIL